MAGKTFFHSQGEDGKYIDFIFWSLMGVGALLPVFVFLTLTIPRPRIIHMLRSSLRYRPYALRQLERRGNTRYSLCYVLFYRHRPILMELVKVAVELNMIAYIFEFVEIKSALSWWCAYDVIVVIYIFNSLDLSGRSGSGQGPKLATRIYLAYSFIMGFPFGFGAKVVWIMWLEGMASFDRIFVPFYLGGAVALAFCVYCLIPDSVYRCCRNDASERGAGRVYLISTLILYITLVTFLGLNIELCGTSDLPTIGRKHICVLGVTTYTAALMPLTLLVLSVLFIVCWMSIYSGMLFRFLPELMSMWSVCLAAPTMFYYLDKQSRTVLLAAVLPLSVASVVSLMCNISLLYMIIHILRYSIPNRERDIAEGRRVRHFSTSERRKNQEKREAMLMAYFKKTGRMDKLDPNINNKRRKSESKKVQTLKGTLFRQLSAQNRDDMSKCCICFEEYTGNKHDIVLAIIKKCGHYFHYDCVWDWLLKRPTCPMCRQSTELNEDGIGVLSFYDLKHAMKINRPVSPDAESTINTISVAGESIDEQSLNAINDKEAPPDTLKEMIESSKELAKRQESGDPVPGTSTQPDTFQHPNDIKDSKELVLSVPPEEREMIALMQIDAMNSALAASDMQNKVEAQVHENVSNEVESRTRDRRSSYRGSREIPTSDVLPNDIAPEPSSFTQHLSTIKPPPRGERRPSRSEPEHPRRRSEPHSSRRPDVPQQRKRNQGSDQPRNNQAVDHLRRLQHQERHRILENPMMNLYKAHRYQGPPSNINISIPEAALSEISVSQQQMREKYQSQKRQGAKRCEICMKRYGGDTQDIVVGYIHFCGHFYHCLCIDKHVRKHWSCPRCVYERQQAIKNGKEPRPELRVHFGDIYFAFLSDMIQPSRADRSEVAPISRGRRNQERY